MERLKLRAHVVDPDELQKAVRRWVIAEWLFRHGPHCFGDRATEAYCDAEDGLRLALTGSTSPSGAAAALGIDTTPREWVRRVPVSTAPKRVRLRVGLFE